MIISGSSSGLAMLYRCLKAWILVPLTLLAQLNLNEIEQQVARLWNALKSHRNFITRIILIAWLAINIVLISFVLSTVLFGTFYFQYKPEVLIQTPLNFKYNRSCMETHRLLQNGQQHLKHLHPDDLYQKSCYPSASLQLYSPQLKKKSLVDVKQAYSVSVTLELPETPGNFEIRVFTVTMTVEGFDATKTSHVPCSNSKKKKNNKESNQDCLDKTQITGFDSLSLRYKSLTKYLLQLPFCWPWFLFGDESQTVTAHLFEEFSIQEASYNWSAVVTIDSPSIHIYSAKMDFVANLSILQTLFYRWPIISFTLGASLLFIPTVIAVLILFYLVVWKLVLADGNRLQLLSFFSEEAYLPEDGTTDDANNDEDDAEIARLITSADTSNQTTTNNTSTTNLAKDDSSTSSSSSIEMIGQSRGGSDGTVTDNDGNFDEDMIKYPDELIETVDSLQSDSIIPQSGGVEQHDRHSDSSSTDIKTDVDVESVTFQLRNRSYRQQDSPSS